MTRSFMNSLLVGLLVSSAAMICPQPANADHNVYIDAFGNRIRVGHHRHHGWRNNWYGYAPRYYDSDRYYRVDPNLYLRSDPRWYGYRPEYRRWW